MFSVASGSATFSGDQQFDIQIQYYDTPFLVLEGTGNLAASAGVELNVREPNVGSTWTLAADLEAAATPSGAHLEFDDVALKHVIDYGRAGNLVGYWAGGAPGEHGVSQAGRVGYQYRMFLRPGQNRAWFASGDTVPVTFAFGGNGYFRIDHANATNLVNQAFTEQDFLEAGLAISPTVSATPGQLFEFYYVQRPEDKWGGFVFKAIFGDISGLNDEERLVIIRDAPIVGCGFGDVGTAVTARTINAWTSADVFAEAQRVKTAEVELPLVNPAVTDLVGWQYERDPFNALDPGSLFWLNAGEATGQYSIYRDRIVRMTATINGNESWPLFTGYIVDFQHGDAASTIKLLLSDPSQTLITQFDRNRPDRIDYMTYNYRRRYIGYDPMYDIPAFDNWPLEYAVRILLSRGGIDASLLEQPLQSPFYGQTLATAGGRVIKKFEAWSMDNRRIKLARAVHYGNYGQAFTELLPADDPYLFPPINTKNLLGRAEELCDRYGYTLGFDAYGHANLRKVHAPVAVSDFDAAEGTNSTNGAAPEAHAGTYVQVTTGGVISKTIRGSRIDIAVGRFLGAGTWGYSLARASLPGTPIATGTITNMNTARTEFFYDYEVAVDGANATVATVWSGTLDSYIITLTATGTCRIDCALMYLVDPEVSLVPQTLRTGLNAKQILPQSSADQMRNHVIVVGRRQATITDSEKIRSTPENPEAEFVTARAVDVRSITDPTALHYVGRVKETIIFSDQIPDNDFAQYLARTFIFRYKNPDQSASVQEHSLLPFLELKDPVLLAEETYDTLTDAKVQWITKIQHRLNPTQWTTSLDTTPFPPYPSFEPRADIDIDRVFSGMPAIDVEIGYKSVSGHDALNMSGGAPLMMRDGVWPAGERVEATMTIAGNALNYGAAVLPMPLASTIQVRPYAVPDNAGITRTKTDIAVGLFKFGTERVVSGLVLTNLQRIVSVQASTVRLNGLARSPTFTLTENPLANTSYLSYHLVGNPKSPQMVIRRTWRFGEVIRLPDGTIVTANDSVGVIITVNWIEGSQDSTAEWLANTPYHNFTQPQYSTEKILLPWEQGDATDYRYERNALVTQLETRYRTFPAWANYVANGVFYSGDISPFYDPYTSELGHLVKVKFDLLVTGLVRVSVRNRNNPNIVAAWLTEPTQENPDGEAHWQYMTAGSNKTFFWDGVDTVGVWNFLQSEDYANAAAGTFELDQKPRIGKGFYVWNRERDGGNLGPLALIDSPFNLLGVTEDAYELAENAVGTFSSWYVLVEAKNDELEMRAKDLNGRAVPRKLDTRALLAEFQSNGSGSLTEALVHTHLFPPSRLELTANDWYGASFDENDLSATGFGPNGVYWNPTSDADASINNQQPVRFRFNAVNRPGALWASNQGEQSIKLTRMAHLKAVIHDQFVIYDGVSYPNSSVESKQIVSRRLHNDAHTVRFEDTVYHKAEAFEDAPIGKGLAWIFLPKHFRRPFTGSEALEVLEFGNYLQLEEVPKHDPTLGIGGARSRLNLAFMGYLFYLSAYTQDRSGRFAWAIDPSFVDQSKILNQAVVTTWPADMQRQHRRTVITRQWLHEKPDGVNLWKDQQKQKWQLTGTIGEQLLEHKWQDHDPTSATINGVAWTSFGLPTDQYTDYHRTNGNMNTVAGLTATTVGRQLPDTLGLWQFESAPSWTPCVFRDFWPYHLIPPMTDTNYARTPAQVGDNLALTEAQFDNLYASVDKSPYDQRDNTGNDPARGDIWSSGIYDQTEVTANKKKFDPGTTIAYKAPPVKQNGDVIALHMLDYTRQDDTVHWEELRGIFSRGPRPAEQVKKVTSTSPYYVNAYEWETLSTIGAYNGRSGTAQSPYPKLSVAAGNHFWMSFRHTYNWESATLFPTDLFGVEQLAAANLERARFDSAVASKGSLRYDSGAWVGWKENLGVAPLQWKGWGSDWKGLAFVGEGSVFDSGFMPVASSMSLPTTRSMYMHLVLVNERRLTPLSAAAYTSASPTPAQIVLTPTSITDVVGTSVSVSVQAVNGAGDPTETQRILATVDTPQVAQVTARWPSSNDIVVTLRQAGSATITFQIGDVIETLIVTAT